MSRKGQSITLSVSDDNKRALERLALEFGMLWGENPNISKLIAAIASGKLNIAPNCGWQPERINALKLGIDALTDAGKLEEALIVAKLLVERSELSLPLKAKIEQFIGNPPPAWRITLNQYIHRQQPFRLFYQDATGRLWNYTVRHARIVPHEERQYLDCWCEETEGNLDVPELKHNWSLRLDRIPEAGIIPITGEWRNRPDTLPVEMHLYHRLAFAYKPKSEDISAEFLPDVPNVRRVIRQISSTYWFLREVKRNSPDIEIVAPEAVRDRFVGELRQLCQRYDFELRPHRPNSP